LVGVLFAGGAIVQIIHIKGVYIFGISIERFELAFLFFPFPYNLDIFARFLRFGWSFASVH